MNPYAHKYCIENIYLNRVGERVNAMQGDVSEVCPSLNMKYDRIMMPLPKGALKFIDVAMPLLTEGGILHIYNWASENDLYAETKKQINQILINTGKTGEITKTIKVSQYSPRTWKIRIDLRVTTK